MFNYLKRLFFGAPENEKKPLNLYQYKFLRFKEEREKIYPLSLSKVEVCCEKDLVSVILPVYNGEKFMSDSIKSVLSQSYENLELIIVNDGSKDNTLGIAREFEKSDKRVRVIDKPNERLPKTLSRGFSEARGEFLTWTSDDNIMDSNFIEKMVDDLKKKPNTAMVYANMRLIDQKGKKLKNHGWFEYPMGSSNVIFPSNAYELNTYANNTIGAAFMYRKSAMEALGCYSSYKHTLEDYDYWMRMNSLFELRHTDFRETVYSYRWHSNSLTAKDNELGITKNRYKLMVFDDFRRDAYMSPLIWYIKKSGTGLELAEKFRETVLGFGHIVLEKEDFKNLYFGSSPSNVCFVSFGGVEQDVFLPADAVKVCVNGSGEEKGFDIFAAVSGGGKKGSGYYFADVETMAAFLDAKIKNDILYGLEGRTETEKPYARRLSAVLCTYKKTETLKESLRALCEQSADKESYEILLVNNDFKNTEIKELAAEFSKEYPKVNLSYITAPVKGLSHARNCGMWAAEGEYILYVDDDAVADKDLVLQTIGAFDENPDMGVCGGQIELRVPSGAEKIVNDETISLWSNFKISGESVRIAADYGEFPYGANFAVRSSCLRQIGGFRCGYGRKGNDFGGGEETLVCFMMSEIGKKVGINPNSRVVHKVFEDRFTIEHIEKTAYAGILTQYRLRRDLYAPADWNDTSVKERAVTAEKKAEKNKENAALFALYKSTAKAFRDVYLNRQRDYEYLVKRGKE